MRGALGIKVSIILCDQFVVEPGVEDGAGPDPLEVPEELDALALPPALLDALLSLPELFAGFVSALPSLLPSAAADPAESAVSALAAPLFGA
jgi:hypothetical protein